MDSREPHFSVHTEGSLGAHRHRNGYAALVVSGGFRECGPDGIWECQEGDLVLHPPYHLHADTFSWRGARVFNIELSNEAAPDAYQVLTVSNLDRLVRRLRHDRDELNEATRHALPKSQTILDDWRGSMAQRLAQSPASSITALAREYGVSLPHVSRAFRKAFGIGAAAFRAEHRLRAAIRLLSGSGLSIAHIAHACGFADQAHLTRSLVAATGRTPARARAP